MHPPGSMDLGHVALISLEKFSEGHSASTNTVITKEEELGSLGGTPQQVWQPVIHSLALATFFFFLKKDIYFTFFFFKGIPLFLFFIFLFIYFWLCWVFVSVRGLSLVVVSGGHSSSRCASLSLSRPLLLRSTGSRRAGSVVVAHRPSCSAACGIFPDQDSNPCPLHWQTDSQPLRHQGSPPRPRLPPKSSSNCFLTIP